MRRLCIISAGVMLLLFTACERKKDAPEQPDTPAAHVPVQQPEVPDSMLWGHLGEDTGMSALQFITEAGDTLEVCRTSQYTGIDGVLLGEIRNYTDCFAMTLTEGNETLVTAINVTQLRQQWHAGKVTMNIKDDGTVTGDDTPYNGWKLWNCHILLSSEQQQEYGTVLRVDTMDIVRLDRDSLVIRDHVNRIQSFSAK